MSDQDEHSAAREATTPRSRMRLGLAPLALAGSLGALELLRSRFQRSQLFLPTRYPAGSWNPGRHGLSYQDAWFKTEDGFDLHGWWLEHPHSRATVIYCHGNRGSIGDRIEVFAAMRRLEADLFVFDYRGYGRSAGEPSEKGLFADVRAAFDYVCGPLGRDPRRVLLFGHSLGGGVAIDGALHRPAAGLVVQSTFTSIRDMAHYRYSRPIPWIASNQFRNLEKVPELEMPTFFIHGMADATIPLEMGERLFAAVPEPKRWLAVPAAGHNDVHEHDSRRYFRTLKQFVNECVSG